MIFADCSRPYFYPRPPGGGRHHAYKHLSTTILFLSTPSGWRATASSVRFLHSCLTFLSTPSGWRATMVISIYRLRRFGFLSTPSGWRATGVLHRIRKGTRYFYPRPPGGGRPPTIINQCVATTNFYPRPPGGGRHRIHTKPDRVFQFLSTPSGWRATACKDKIHRERHISIHALRVEGDCHRLSFH